jgi:branched-subunit amino acid transport protein
MLDHWILIGVLAVATYLSRIVGLEMMAGRQMSPTLRLYFNYVPVAIIAALVVKQILVPTDGQIVISAPVLIGCLATAITLKLINRFLTSVIVGIVIGLLVRYLLMS